MALKTRAEGFATRFGVSLALAVSRFGAQRWWALSIFQLEIKTTTIGLFGYIIGQVQPG